MLCLPKMEYSHLDCPEEPILDQLNAFNTFLQLHESVTIKADQQNSNIWGQCAGFATGAKICSN